MQRLLLGASCLSAAGAVGVSSSSSRTGVHHALSGAGALAARANLTVLSHLDASRPPRGIEAADFTFFSYLFGHHSTGEKRVEAVPKCGISVVVGHEEDRDLKCPDECPIVAEHMSNGRECDFRCVPATFAACKEMSPDMPIPDTELGVCRACMVAGCGECLHDGTDTCMKCSEGYYLATETSWSHTAGQCYSEFFWIWVGVFSVFGMIFLVVLAWILSLALAPIVNLRILQVALEHRSRSKLLMPKQGNRQRKPWPLLTNLCTTPVAGPGLQLQFNFQAALIFWAFLVGFAWWVMTIHVDPGLGTLGWTPVGTPRQNCIAVAAGYRQQIRLMPHKIRFMMAMYTITFAMCIAFAVMQLRRFRIVDAEQTTHKDFCARCRGLPRCTGEVELERELKAALTEALGKQVVNISVCWGYQEQSEDLLKVLEDDLAERDREHRNSLKSKRKTTAEAQPTVFGDVPDQEDGRVSQEVERQCWAFEVVERRMFGDAQAKVLQTPRRHSIGEACVEHGCSRDAQVKEQLLALQCTGQAFVVFNTEEDRDTAVQQAEEKGGVPFRDGRVTLEVVDIEPASMMWQNCVEKDWVWKFKMGCIGLVMYFAALSFWVAVFYAPYAYIMLSSNYAYGQEPSMLSNIAFTMVVVAGNALMYFTCSEISDRLGFESVDNREVLYMILYTIACLLNVLLDMVVTYYMVYEMMVGINMRTPEGKHLREVTSFTERFETFAMQRSLGENLYRYAFPSTFLVPFLLEPIGTLYLPYRLMSWIVRANTSISQWSAERLMMCAPMDLSRYADLILNVMLAALIFYFPPGFTHYIFFALAGCHVLIYLLDQYKVLRCIPTCYFSTNDVDFWAQWLLCIPCGLIMSGMVFKINSCQFFGGRLHGYPLVALCVASFVLHIALHTLALLYIVPMLVTNSKSSAGNGVEYRSFAKKFPVSWFASNPVHCLRSKYIYAQEPPCDFMMAGKEHLLRVNAKEGYHFHDREAKVEKYHDTLKDVQEHLQQSVSRTLFSGKKVLSGNLHPEEVDESIADSEEQYTERSGFQAHAAPSAPPPAQQPKASAPTPRTTLFRGLTPR